MRGYGGNGYGRRRDGTATALATGAAGAMARALERGRLMPAPSVFAAQSGYTPAGLFLVDDPGHGNLHDAVANLDFAAVGGVSLYLQTMRNLRGVTVPSDNFGWGAARWNPALASQAVVGGFVAGAHAAQAIALWGYNSSATPGRLYARIRTADDKVEIVIASDGAAQFTTVVIDHVIVFGDAYLLAYHINRTTGFLYSRLVSITTGLAYTGTPLDISGYGPITGTGTLTFHVGAVTGAANGTGITHLGVAVITAGIEGATVLENMSSGLVGV